MPQLWSRVDHGRVTAASVMGKSGSWESGYCLIYGQEWIMPRVTDASVIVKSGSWKSD